MNFPSKLPNYSLKKLQICKQHLRKHLRSTSKNKEGEKNTYPVVRDTDRGRHNTTVYTRCTGWWRSRTATGKWMWIPSYFLHFVSVGLCPVLDGLLLLLCGTQLLPQLLQLLQQRGHLVGFVLGLLLHPAQPVQLATHPLALHCVGVLQTD